MDRQDPRWMEGLEEAKVGIHSLEKEVGLGWREGDREALPGPPEAPPVPFSPLISWEASSGRAQVRSECPIPRGMQAPRVSEPDQDCCSSCSGKPPYLPGSSAPAAHPAPGPHKPGSQGCSTGRAETRIAHHRVGPPRSPQAS